ncbi:regulatory protein RecX [archaeon]|nr:regulatory protein RecX [archaeon]
MFKKTKNYAAKDQPQKIFDPARLYSYSLWMLSRRDYTIFELSQKMKKYQPDDSIILTTVEKLISLGYLNDERRATNIINSYIKKESSHKIKRRLSEKGVSKELIEEVINECINDDIELEMAKNNLLKKFKIYDAEKKQKYCSFLASRGYGWNIISKSIAFLKEELLNQED